MNELRAAWNELWHGWVHPARPYFAMKAVLGLLAFDTWMEMISHGGRYGVGDFNVSHVRWLDAIQPTPSPAIYIGTLVFCGLLAMTMVVTKPHRIGLLMLAIAYTYSWAMSMLDSYQHHYLLSLVLFCFVFFPLRTADEAHAVARAVRPRPSSAGFIMLGVTCALVYAFTYVAKTTGGWGDGHVLQQIAGCRTVDEEMHCRAEFVQSLIEGQPDPAAVLRGLAVGAMVVQVVSAVGYLGSCIQDRSRGWFLPTVLLVMSFAPISFHIYAERLGLNIGWFSYYMLVLAMVYFWPARVWELALDGVAWLQRYGLRVLGRQERTEMVAKLVVLIAALAITIWLAYRVDLPGVVGAAIVFAGLAVVAYVLHVLAIADIAPRSLALGALLAGVCMWISLTGTDEDRNVRFDYYRFVGGDMRRREDLEASLEAYIKANRYAPRDCEALRDPDRTVDRRRCDRRREEQEVRAARAGR